MVERVDQHGPGLVGVRRRGRERLVDRVAHETDVGAVGPGGLLLGDRRADRHEHGCLGVEQAGGERDPLGVVAGARRDDATGAIGWREPRDAYVRATDLERTGPLQVLAFEEDGTTAADPVGQPAAALHGSDPGDAAEHVACSLDVGQQRMQIGIGVGVDGRSRWCFLSGNHDRSLTPGWRQAWRDRPAPCPGRTMIMKPYSAMNPVRLHDHDHDHGGRRIGVTPTG
jgi:hypothetical protein